MIVHIISDGPRTTLNYSPIDSDPAIIYQALKDQTKAKVEGVTKHKSTVSVYIDTDQREFLP